MASRPPFHIPADWERFRHVIDRFDTLEATGRRGVAWGYLDSLLAAKRASGESRRVVQVLLKRGGTRTWRGDYRGGKPDLEESQRLARSVRDTLGELLSLQYLAYGAIQSGRLADAQPLYDRMVPLAMANRDRSHEAWARMGLAFIDLRSGRRERARDGYRRTVRLMQACGDSPGLLEARIGLANALNALGEQDEAVAEYRRLVDDATRAGARQTLANALLNLGHAEQNRGDPQIAAQLIQKAEQTYRAVGDGGGARTAALERAEALVTLGRLDAAAEVIGPLLAEARAHGAMEEWASACTGLADVRRRQGRGAEAERLHRMVLAIGDSVSRRTREFTRVGLASFLLGQRRWSEAIAAAESARASPGFPAIVGSSDRVGAIVAMGLLRQGRVREAAESIRSADRYMTGRSEPRGGGLVLARAMLDRAQGRPDSALAALRTILRDWENWRERSSDPEWREMFGNNTPSFMGFLLRVLAEEPSVPAGAPRARRAFETVQVVKGRTLLERMDRGAMRLRSPEGRAPVTLARMQRLLGPGEVFLDYYVGLDTSAVFAVTSREIRMKLLPSVYGLDALVSRASGVFQRSDADTGAVRATAEALAAVAWPGLGDLLSKSSRVLVSADGVLNELPFSAMPPSRGAPPLVSRAEVARVSSAALLVRLRERAASTAPRPLLAFAGQRNELGQRLPRAVEEVRWLAGRYAGVDARTSADLKSTDELARALARYQVLHFAGHASSNDEEPWQSGLLVGLGSNQWLRAAEIARLRLPASLAVLSACRSAGTWSRAEGQLGLASAFLSAGVPAVVATQWVVSDETAEAFTREFYPGLARGLTVAAAFRRAQLALQARPETASVSDWGAFVLVGEPGVHITLRPAGVSLTFPSRP